MNPVGWFYTCVYGLIFDVGLFCNHQNDGNIVKKIYYRPCVFLQDIRNGIKMLLCIRNVIFWNVLGSSTRAGGKPKPVQVTTSHGGRLTRRTSKHRIQENAELKPSSPEKVVVPQATSASRSGTQVKR